MTSKDILSLPRESAQRLPRKPGVYFGIIANEIAYIGQSVDMRARCVNHHGELKTCEFAWIETSDHQRIEAELIDQLRPRLNKLVGDENDEALAVAEMICRKCGYRWIPRIARRPHMCPACKSRYWQVEKVKEN